VTSKNYAECVAHGWTWEFSDEMGCPVCFGINIENARLLASFKLWGHTHLNLEESPRVVSTLGDFNLYIHSLEVKSDNKEQE
jgi:hypothetical protein